MANKWVSRSKNRFVDNNDTTIGTEWQPPTVIYDINQSSDWHILTQEILSSDWHILVQESQSADWHILLQDFQWSEWDILTQIQVDSDWNIFASLTVDEIERFHTQIQDYAFEVASVAFGFDIAEAYPDAVEEQELGPFVLPITDYGTYYTSVFKYAYESGDRLWQQVLN